MLFRKHLRSGQFAHFQTMRLAQSDLIFDVE
jgi:hypothetical protein